jgi:hypothetical protein
LRESSSLPPESNAADKTTQGAPYVTLPNQVQLISPHAYIDESFANTEVADQLPLHEGGAYLLTTIFKL